MYNSCKSCKKKVQKFKSSKVVISNKVVKVIKVVISNKVVSNTPKQPKQTKQSNKKWDRGILGFWPIHTKKNWHVVKTVQNDTSMTCHL